ncbi:hypothetical protein [Burkholderia pseudomallei]|uniref:hypothetical protein n=1 Tax=Burkholderia pseudomallei TaxID=28450 RepID=UPI00100B4F77|nr:hypothetical protein [Burkholderia pseudomallei]
MTQFGPKAHVYKASRQAMGTPDPELTFDRMRRNQALGIETHFVADNNLMIQIDLAIETDQPATDATLEQLLEWVAFLRACDRQKLPYGLTTFFAYAEMPAALAQSRAARLQRFADKFSLEWRDGEGNDDYAGLGLTQRTFDALDVSQQVMMGISFSALLLMLLINRDGADFSPIGKFRRYLREYKLLIETVSVREIAIARYVFATQKECPGELDRLRSRIDKNFARNKREKRPVALDDMCATALNGAFDLLLFNVMNIVDTRGVEGKKLDCWLVSMDEKLKVFNDLCHNVDMGTGRAGALASVASHEDASEYWKQTGDLIEKLSDEVAGRLLAYEMRRIAGAGIADEIRKERLAGIPEKARAVIALVEAGL